MLSVYINLHPHLTRFDNNKSYQHHGSISRTDRRDDAFFADPSNSCGQHAGTRIRLHSFGKNVRGWRRVGWGLWWNNEVHNHGKDQVAIGKLPMRSYTYSNHEPTQLRTPPFSPATAGRQNSSNRYQSLSGVLGDKHLNVQYTGESNIWISHSVSRDLQMSYSHFNVL